ncbi:MAG: zinc-binding dehydrogenase [Anaerolineae bacterium]|nr:zinc-binding dehydrogenase [Anaerolineae bacterium]MDW8070172.1 zinc-binding dehydrogenase [Anaerolineae bacterium]
MTDKLAAYRLGSTPLPKTHRLWPLYGAGLENFGLDGTFIEVPMPAYGPDELLVRHDACGLCFSDIKVINLGEKHPRIFRDIRREPIVLGHEVCMTVVGVGENLRDQYKVGDRFIIQADIKVGGVGYAYGYMIQGGLSQYNVIDQRILNGDDGNYLIPVRPTTGYVESALVEPWACVIAAYRLRYRTALKPGGTLWIVGPSTPLSDELPYTISAGFDEEAHPARLMLTRVPLHFSTWLKQRAAQWGIPVVEVVDLSAPPFKPVDDLVLLHPTAEDIEITSPHLADFGVAALVGELRLTRPVSIDVGRIHYNRWVYVASTSPDVARAYSDVPVRSALRKGGRVWFVGAGGPMGRMHVQRAVQLTDGPSTIVCSDISDLRLRDLCDSYGVEAAAKGIRWICVNPTNREAYEATMAEFLRDGFDDIIVLVPVPDVIADAAHYLAPRGVMNVFAGVQRGTMVNLDLAELFARDARVIGHSASNIEDMQVMLMQVEAGELDTNRSLAAIGSLEAARDGMQAVIDARFPGKVVIFPNIKPLPLTPLPELREKMPSVYARLKDGREWTREAEEEFLRLMLP